MNLILNSQSLTRNNHSAPGDLLRCYEVLETWHLGISPQEIMAPQFSRMRNLSATHLYQGGQHSSPAFLFSQTVLRSKAEEEIPLWFQSGWMHRAWAIFPFAAFLCQPTWRDTSLSRANLLLPGKLTQLFYHSHILQTDEEFLRCLFLLKFFTKSFYICSACEKILLHVLKIWNSSSCNGISCTLHLPSLIGAVWLWIVLSLTRAKSESVSCQ